MSNPITDEIRLISSGLLTLGLTQAKQSFTLELAGGGVVDKKFTYGVFQDSSLITQGYQKEVAAGNVQIELRVGWEIQDQNYTESYLELLEFWEDKLSVYLFKTRDVGGNILEVSNGGMVIESLYSVDFSQEVLQLTVALSFEGGVSI